MNEETPPDTGGAVATSRRAHPVAVVASAALLAGCVAQSPDDGQTYSAVADVSQLMSTILEPAADHYWDAVGWIDEAAGTTEIAPRTEEEWAAVRNAAFVIAESGNLLLMPERVVDDPAWVPMAQALVEVGRQAIEAAEFREPIEVFNVGAEVYFVCTNCHARFAVETLPPADERAAPGGQ